MRVHTFATAVANQVCPAPAPNISRASASASFSGRKLTFSCVRTRAGSVCEARKRYANRHGSTYHRSPHRGNTHHSPATGPPPPHRPPTRRPPPHFHQEVVTVIPTHPTCAPADTLTQKPHAVSLHRNKGAQIHLPAVVKLPGSSAGACELYCRCPFRSMP